MKTKFQTKILVKSGKAKDDMSDIMKKETAIQVASPQPTLLQCYAKKNNSKRTML